MDRTAMPSTLTLDDTELIELTGYRQPCHQLAELRRQGFWRARRSPTTGAIILERAHYEAVSTGRAAYASAPKVRPPKLRMA